MTSSPAGLPILNVVLPIHMDWQQHTPGGCRCICAFFHDGEGSCAEAAEPGLFAHVISENTLSPNADPTDLGVVVVCRGCYQRIAARPDTDG